MIHSNNIQEGEIPGVRFSSCHVLSTRTPKIKDKLEHKKIFDLGAIIDPFYQYPNNNIASRSPIICLSCSCYLSSYVLINQENGSWYCPFCHMINPKFHSDFQSIDPSNRIQTMQSTYAELQSKHFDYEEPVHISNSMHKSLSRIDDKANIKVFAIDETLCNCNETISMLKEGIVALAPATEVCIIVFGQCINILRLNGMVLGCNPVQVDVLAGQVDQSQLYLHLIKRGMYCLSSTKLLKNFEIIQNCLGNLYHCATTTAVLRSQSQYCGAALDVIVKLAVAMQQSKASLRGVSLLLLACRSILLSPRNEFLPTPNDVKALIEGYSLLGQWALGFSCSIDVYFGSMNSGNLNHLDALVSMSGGYVVVANSYIEPQFRASFIQLLSCSTRYCESRNSTGTIISEESQIGPGFEISDLSMPTIEVRTCGRVEVDRIIGPIATAEDVLLLNANKLSSNDGVLNTYNNSANEILLKAAELTVDASHVSHSLFFVNHGDVSLDKTKGIENSQEEVYKRLVDHSVNNVVACGISARPVLISKTEKNDKDSGKELSFRETSISIQFKPSMRYMQRATEEEEEGHYEASAYVQFVVRYQIRRRSSDVIVNHRNDVLMKVTRVWTHRINVTQDIDEYLHGLDAKLWTYVISKEIVADYQSQIIESFGGVLKKTKLNESGIYTYLHIRSNAKKFVDELIRDISLFWCGRAVNSSEVSSTYTRMQKMKIMEACRILYHLSEGPLLDGPTMQPMESYLFRTTFLRTSYKQGINMIMPSMKLSINLLLQQLLDTNKQINESQQVGNIENTNISYSNSSSSYSINDRTYKNLTQSLGVLGLVIVNPDTTSLFPGSIAFLDAGDRIIIRENDLYDEASQSHGNLSRKQGLLDALEAYASEIAYTRYPIPRIHVLSLQPSPNDRLLYCCLTPTHMDYHLIDDQQQLHMNINNYQATSAALPLSQLQLQLTPQISIPLTKSNLENIIKRAPITDEPSFYKFLQKTISNDIYEKILVNINQNIESSTVSSTLSQLNQSNAINAEFLKNKAPVSISMDREISTTLLPSQIQQQQQLVNPSTSSVLSSQAVESSTNTILFRTIGSIFSSNLPSSNSNSDHINRIDHHASKEQKIKVALDVV